MDLSYYTNQEGAIQAPSDYTNQEGAIQAPSDYKGSSWISQHMSEVEEIENMTPEDRAAYLEANPITRSRDIFDSVGDVFNDVSGVTTAREIGDAQEEAITRAEDATEQGYERASGFLEPYSEGGGQFLGGLAEGVESGQWVPGEFNYSGEQTGPFSYSGSQSGDLGYEGDPNITSNYAGRQRGFTGYQGGPEMGSIQSFMGDPSQDAGYQFQQAEGQKAIDRAAAAGGRFGGGQTAKELMKYSQGLASQQYGQAFNRAGQERDAQRFGEQDRFGRAMQNTALGNQAEQSSYNRSMDQAQIGRGIEAEQQRRSIGDFDRRNAAELSDYGRATNQYNMDVNREQQGYGREQQNYAYNADRMANELAQRQYMTGLGQNAATAMSNAAIGQGSNMSNIAIQRGNANAAQLAAEGTGAGNFLDLVSRGAEAYGKSQGAG